MIAVIPWVWFGVIVLDPRREAAKLVFAMVSLGAAAAGVVYLFALSAVLEGLQRRTGDWNGEVQAWYRKFRRNLKIGVAVMVLLAAYAVTASDSARIAATGMLLMLAVVIELISLETAMGRVAVATRVELAAAKESPAASAGGDS